MVTAAKPKVGGAIYRAPSGTTLPTDASSALAGTFVAIGYNTEDGVTRAIDQDTEVVKAWGGDTVLVLENSRTETFQFSMLDAHSVEALKIFNGDSNVTGSALSTGISVTSNNSEKGDHVFVIEMIEAGNTLHRIVIPKGVVTEVEDITYVDNAAVAYGVTITALSDSSGNSSYDYFKTASA